ncbi:MAG TPA: transketolase [Polyangia bacterium]|jgi:transketolase|nr:transketolase [Polyangia bacterium]
MLDDAMLETLRRRAFDLRLDSLNAVAAAESGHPGGTLSAIDLLQALYFVEMKHRPKEPHWPERDRFVLSKGHAAPALYSVLAHAGYFSTDLLPSLRRLGSPLQGHPVNFLLPGVEASTGSPGQGLSVAVGMALAAKLDGSAARIYTLIGDGESQQGQIWEAALCAPKYALDNLCVILDHHDAREPLAERWRAFDFDVRTIDGHDYQQIAGAFDAARAAQGKPALIVAETVEGKGVSFMENQRASDGVAPNKEQLAQAIAELRAAQPEPA